jgi:hypothetical protein
MLEKHPQCFARHFSYMIWDASRKRICTPETLCWLFSEIAYFKDFKFLANLPLRISEPVAPNDPHYQGFIGDSLVHILAVNDVEIINVITAESFKLGRNVWFDAFSRFNQYVFYPGSKHECDMRAGVLTVLQHKDFDLKPYLHQNPSAAFLALPCVMAAAYLMGGGGDKKAQIEAEISTSPAAIQAEFTQAIASLVSSPNVRYRDQSVTFSFGAAGVGQNFQPVQAGLDPANADLSAPFL